MMGNNQNLFFPPEEKGRAFSDVLKEVQEYISSKYSTLMVEGGNDEVKQQVKRYISLQSRFIRNLGAMKLCRG